MVDQRKNIKISLIATYPKMAEIFMNVTRELGIEAYNIYASFEEAASIAKSAESKMDAFLSRGGTGRYIMNAVDKPVIIIPITPFDVMQVIHSIERNVKEVALIHYKDNVPEVDKIEVMCGVKINQYTFLNNDDIIDAVEDSLAKGVKHIVGGKVAVEYAEERGGIGYELSSGEAAVRSAIVETINVLNEKEKERKRTARIEAVFESISDGVIVTDEDHDISVINQTAKKLLDNSGKISMAQVNKEIGPSFKEVTETGVEKVNEIKSFNNKIVMSNLKPVKLDGKTIGAVGVYSDVTLIQKAEKKIRKELSETGLTAKYGFDNIITTNKDMMERKEIASKYAQTESAVLIEGESGTGKELFAQGIHQASKRSNGPFVAINCAAIGENLLESELFGYVEGAFTGASKGGKTGLFEQAHGGTLFMDEIGEISMSVQTSLLRVLQEKEIRRIGGKGNVPVDVRIVSATNKNLKKMVEEGKFRNDLYYRLSVLNVKVPPLRQRKDDLDVLCRHFVKLMNASIPEDILSECIESFKEYSWPGNIRELSNVIERLDAMYPYIATMDGKDKAKRVLGIEDEGEQVNDLEVTLNMEGSLKEIIRRTEKQVIDYFMDAYDDDQDMVAERLDIGKTTLWRKAKEE